MRTVVSLVMSACILEEFTTVTRHGPESPERRVTPAVCSIEFNLTMTWQKNIKYKSFLLLLLMIGRQMFFIGYLSVYSFCSFWRGHHLPQLAFIQKGQFKEKMVF